MTINVHVEGVTSRSHKQQGEWSTAKESLLYSLLHLGQSTQAMDWPLHQTRGLGACRCHPRDRTHVPFHQLCVAQSGQQFPQGEC